MVEKARRLRPSDRGLRRGSKRFRLSGDRLQALLNDFGDAQKFIFGPYRFRGYVEGVGSPAYVAKAMCRVRDFVGEHPHLKPRQIFKSLLSYYCHKRTGKAPPLTWLASVEYYDMLGKVVKALVELYQWKQKMGVHEGFERFKCLCRKIGLQMFSKDPLLDGKSSLTDWNEWCILKAYVEYIQTSKQLEHENGVDMGPSDYLSANLAWMRRSRFFEVEYLFGEKAADRARQYVLEHEGRRKISPGRRKELARKLGPRKQDRIVSEHRSV